MIAGIGADPGRHLTTRDGTRIGYQVRGPAGAPVVVLANGLGGTHVVYRFLYEALADYRTICWDYRGLYTSAAPADPQANTIAHQVDDLVEILANEHVDDFVMVGWSMGVQVAFETMRHHHRRVRGLLALNGTAGHAFQTVLGSRFVASTIPMLLRLIRAQAALANFATRAIAGSDALISTMQRIGLVSATMDVPLFRAVTASFQSIDWRIYSDLLSRLDEHDASDVLASIAVPVGIVTGDRDAMVPAVIAEGLHRRIAGSTLVVIAGGTHYTLMESPAIVVAELGRLLDRVPGWERSRARQAS